MSTANPERFMRTYDPHKNTTEARQGDRRLMTTRVLAIGIVAVVVAFALIWWVFFMQTGSTAS